MPLKKDPGATVALGQTVSGIAELKIISGTLDLSGFTVSQQPTGTNLLSVSDSGTLKIGGTIGLPTFSTYLFDTLSTVDYAGSIQTIASVTPYGNLVISAAGNKLPPAL